MLRHLLSLAILVCFQGRALADEAQTPPPKALTYEQLSPDDQEIYDRGEINTGQIVGGGLASTFIGLGIGQAIEGRYTSKGWIFTVGEIGSVTLLVAGAANCEASLFSGGDCSSGATMIVVGYLGYLVFRVWDAVDAWVMPQELNRRYHRLHERMERAGLDFGFAAYRATDDHTPVFGLNVSF